MSVGYLLATLALGAIALWQTFVLHIAVRTIGRMVVQYRESRRTLAAAIGVAGDAAGRGDWPAYQAAMRRASIIAAQRVEAELEVRR